MTLSPLSPAAVNARSPSSFTSLDLKSPRSTSEASLGTATEAKVETILDGSEVVWDEDNSSPFQSHLQTEDASTKDTAAMQTSTLERARIVSSRTTSSSSKMDVPFAICEDETASTLATSIDAIPTTSALARALKRKSMSPIKSTRMAPFAMSSTDRHIAEDRSSYRHSRRSLQCFPAGHNSALAMSAPRLAVHEEVFAEKVTGPAFGDEETIASSIDRGINVAEDATVDDTCFSTFSEVPNMDMTNFANLNRQSPSKLSHSSFQTHQAATTPSTIRTSRHSQSRSPSPTPKATCAETDTTTLLLDFTQQFEAISTLSHKLRAVSRRSMSPSKTDTTSSLAEPHLRSYLNSQRSPRKSTAHGAASTPSSKNLMTLLDFELPPAPSPRSVPTISVRELESLKSNYASQISALKATLSGREAEVEALKRAVGDAERRVGESAEELRDERGRRECAEKEKEEWVSRGAEFEDVLRRVKKEVLEGEKEREEVLARAEDAEERARELEAQLAESEQRVRRAESDLLQASASAAPSAVGETDGPLFTAEQVQKQIDEKVHILSTELHAIYKKKHVTKVAGLKKGFEAKTKEKTMELAAKIEELERQNDDLQAKLDGTLSGVVPGLLSMDSTSTEQREADLKQLEEQKVVIEKQKAELVGREEELKAQRAEFVVVMAELERERVEKGELVAAVDEMLALQSDMSVVHAAAAEPATAPLVEEALRKSVGLGVRPSGLTKPGFGFGGSRLAKPTTGKSRMMSQIERMGGGRLAE